MCKKIMMLFLCVVMNSQNGNACIVQSEDGYEGVPRDLDYPFIPFEDRDSPFLERGKCFLIDFLFRPFNEEYRVLLDPSQDRVRDVRQYKSDMIERTCCRYKPEDEHQDVLMCVASTRVMYSAPMDASFVRNRRKLNAAGGAMVRSMLQRIVDAHLKCISKAQLLEPAKYYLIKDSTESAIEVCMAITAVSRASSEERWKKLQANLANFRWRNDYRYDWEFAESMLKLKDIGLVAEDSTPIHDVNALALGKLLNDQLVNIINTIKENNGAHNGWRVPAGRGTAKAMAETPMEIMAYDFNVARSCQGSLYNTLRMKKRGMLSHISQIELADARKPLPCSEENTSCMWAGRCISSYDIGVADALASDIVAMAARDIGAGYALAAGLESILTPLTPVHGIAVSARKYLESLLPSSSVPVDTLRSIIQFPKQELINTGSFVETKKRPHIDSPELFDVSVEKVDLLNAREQQSSGPSRFLRKTILPKMIKLLDAAVTARDRVPVKPAAVVPAVTVAPDVGVHVAPVATPLTATISTAQAASDVVLRLRLRGGDAACPVLLPPAPAAGASVAAERDEPVVEVDQYGAATQACDVVGTPVRAPTQQVLEDYFNSLPKIKKIKRGCCDLM